MTAWPGTRGNAAARSTPIDPIMRWANSPSTRHDHDADQRSRDRFIVGFIGRFGFCYDGERLWLGVVR